MDFLDHLTQEHRTAEGLLDQLSASEPGAGRHRVLAELVEALGVHLAVEEEYLYPIVREVVGADEADEADVEHDLARDGLAKLLELADAPGFGAAVEMLAAGIAHHVNEEEAELFPALRARAADRVASLDAEELEARVRSAGARGSSGGGATKEELYQQARKADVPGRSQMSKEELAAARVGDDPIAVDLVGGELVAVEAAVGDGHPWGPAPRGSRPVELRRRGSASDGA